MREITEEQIKEAAEGKYRQMYSKTPYEQHKLNVHRAGKINGFIDGAKWREEQSEWISVSDQTPPLNQNVMAYHPEHDIVLTDCYKEHETLNGKQAYFTHTGITHWAPYPKGPKK